MAERLPSFAPAELRTGRRRALHILAGIRAAPRRAARGGAGSSYFKYSGHDRKWHLRAVFAYMSEPERCFVSKRNREAGSWNFSSGDEQNIPDDKPCGNPDCAIGGACENEGMQMTLRATYVAAFLAGALLLIPQQSHAAEINIGMGPNYFTPPNVTISVGDTIVWQNTDTMAHNVTANDGSFMSATLQPGAVYSRTFNAPGTYFYNCTFHPGMVGTITVVSVATPPPAPIYYSPTPTPVPQPTADALRAQAQALLAKIQQLQQQLGA